MDLDIRTVLRWLIIGVIALLRLVLRVGAVVLVVLLVIRVLEEIRS